MEERAGVLGPPALVQRLLRVDTGSPGQAQALIRTAVTGDTKASPVCPSPPHPGSAEQPKAITCTTCSRSRSCERSDVGSHFAHETCKYDPVVPNDSGEQAWVQRPQLPADTQTLQNKYVGAPHCVTLERGGEEPFLALLRLQAPATAGVCGEEPWAGSSALLGSSCLLSE